MTDHVFNEDMFTNSHMYMLLSEILENNEPPNHFNTRSWADEVKAQLKILPVLEPWPIQYASGGKITGCINPNMESDELLSLKNESENIEKHRVENFDLPKEPYLIPTPVHELLAKVSVGQYPKPEILLAISKAFSLYLIAEGELSLEEVFFNKPIKSIGNYSKRYANEKVYQDFYYELKNSPCRNKKSRAILSLKKQVYFKFNDVVYYKDDLSGIDGKTMSKYRIKELNNITVDSFIKNYYRWKINNL